MDDYTMPFQKLELEQQAFESLETALVDLLRSVKKDRNIVHFRREEGLPSGIAQYRLYLGDNPQVRADFDFASAKYLGYIRIRKLSADVTEIEEQCMVTGDYQQFYIELLQKWKAHSLTSELISQAFRKRNKGKGRNVQKKGKPGRPSYPEDTWAWTQVNLLNRPINQVYQEWLELPEVLARKLVDPKTHFHRFIKRKKMGN